MTVEQIIKDHLEKNKLDGLCNDLCGCSKDDLAPCEGIQKNCVPARLVKCEEDCFCGSFNSNDSYHFEEAV